MPTRFTSFNAAVNFARARAKYFHTLVLIGFNLDADQYLVDTVLPVKMVACAWVTQNGELVVR